MLDSSVLSIVSRCDSYDEMLFVQHGVLSCLRFLVVRSLLVGGLGVEDQQNGFRRVQILLLMIYFCEIGPKKGVYQSEPSK